MTFLVPTMLFGWVPLSILLFRILNPQSAVLGIVIGGALLLPMAGYNFSGLPAYTKATAIALGLILGGSLAGNKNEFDFKLKLVDVPMLIWCLCPVASSITNQLGLYDGIASAIDQILTWGVPYFAGRIYFRDLNDLKDVSLALIWGGLLYLPLCLYEIRMSPQLSNLVYGFFPHDWIQHVRAGGFRPIVFMQHGLMVSLWMAITAAVTFWLWKSGQIKDIKGVPIAFIFFLLLITTILCKSMNGLISLAMACFLYYGTCFSYSSSPVFWLLLCIPSYLLFRMNNVVTGDEIVSIMANFVNTERVDSLAIRLVQEDLFFQRALERFVFGWAGYDRGRPIDPRTGLEISIMIDSLWLITMRSRGIIGIISLYFAMLAGPWLVLRRLPKQKKQVTKEALLHQVLLSLVVILFMIDTLLNGMVNSVYILISGALLGTHINRVTDSI